MKFSKMSNPSAFRYNRADQIPDSLYILASVVTVMSGHDESSLGMNGHHYERTRIILRKDIKEFLESEGLDINVIVNRLLENFIIAYKAFWERISGAWCSGRDLNPGHGIESGVDS